MAPADDSLCSPENAASLKCRGLNRFGAIESGSRACVQMRFFSQFFCPLSQQPRTRTKTNRLRTANTDTEYNPGLYLAVARRPACLRLDCFSRSHRRRASARLSPAC